MHAALGATRDAINDTIKMMWLHYSGHKVKQLYAAIRSLLATDNHWLNSVDTSRPMPTLSDTATGQRQDRQLARSELQCSWLRETS
jgi:hypothetical protein